MPRATKWPFKLGSISLDRFEVPEKFDLGHEVETAVHKYIDEVGSPIIKVHTMGAFPLPTTWNGMLYENDVQVAGKYQPALQRAEDLDRICKQQVPTIWEYGPLQYLVLIKKFRFTPHTQHEIEYEIELVTIKALNGGTPSAPTSAPFNTTTQGYYTQASSAVSTLKTLPVGTALALPGTLTDATDAVDAALAAATPLKSQTVATILSLINTVSVAIQELNDFVGPLEDTAVLEADLERLNQSLIALQGFGLLNRNLQQLVGISESNQVLQGFVGSLFDVASQYYPNADIAEAATAVAQANSLLDLFVYDPTDLQLPALFS